MRFLTLPAIIIFGLSVVTAPVYAQGRGNSQANKPAASASPQVKSTPQTVKTTGKPKSTPKADVQAAKTSSKATAKTAKVTTKAETKAAKTTTKAEARVAKADTKATRKAGTTTSGTVPVTTVVTPTTPMTMSVKNPKLEARLLALLPPNTTIQDASQGFKNWGQFVAAVHVSNNLNIPFADLKMKMTGIAPVTPGTLPTVPTTAATTMSLGQAIESLKGTTTESSTLTSTKIRTEVKKAEDAASADLQRTRDRS
jgi:hypothetical protein